MCALFPLSFSRITLALVVVLSSERGGNDQRSVIETSLPLCLQPALVLPTCPASRPSLLDAAVVSSYCDGSALHLLLWSVALPKTLAGKTFVLLAQKVSQPPKGNLLFFFLKFHLEYTRLDTGVGTVLP